ncbi:ABC transporter ATP-binding protein [Trueperella pyogenes]|uniref:ABC transporter ATP-binding protein n=1 Tax=Trueperella pyogenes TaxID=1661 RepID=UPI000DFD287A|nr:ABC transporter ATP-binding protein [Trueperella pyogenes]MBB3025414.1 ABC-type lipoprotein export system ATPase subunit [Trueperella pyogenes]SUO87762.1 Lipoprotein-releasing system ATP-binding protein LolD [Trueperella pyogenes]
MGLRVDDLSFRYTKTNTDVFTGLTYSFHLGAITALTGPSGCGKSTLLYVLGLMLRPTAGRVSFAEESISTLSDYARSQFRATNIGFVFQDSELDPFATILDSVLEPGLYAGRPYAQLRTRGQELLEQVGLSEFANQRPTQISGGQGQRAAMARSLINDPAIILADEPTGNLDRDNATIILELLRNAALAGRTVVVATHDPFVKDACDDVYDVGKETA